MGLIEEDKAAADVQKTPNRVTLDHMLGKVKDVEYVRPINVRHMTIAIVTLQNGFALVGHSAPADPANYNKELGQKIAFDDCIRQLWALEGYALRQKLHDETPPPETQEAAE